MYQRLRKTLSSFGPIELWFIALCSVLLGLMFALQPPMMDDPGFTYFSKAFTDAPGFGTFLQVMKESVEFRILEDNARIVNLFGNFVVIWPKWLLGIFFGCCCAVTLIVGARMARCSRQLAPFTLFSICFLYLLPWFDGMFTVMHALNYVLPSAISLVAAQFYLNGRQANLIVLFLIFLIVGLFHEAFTAALLGGIIGTVIVFKKFQNRRSVVIIIALAAAIILLGAVPGASRRGSGMFKPEGIYQLTRGILLSAPFYLFVASVGIGLAVRRWRAKFLTPTMAFLFGAALSGWVVYRLFMCDFRIPWTMLLYTGIGLAAVVSATGMGDRRFKGAATAVCVGILVLCLVQTCVSLRWFVVMNREVKEVFSSLDSTPDDDPIYLPLTTSDTAPLYLLGKPSFDVYLTPGFPFSRVVPEPLKDFDPAEADRLEGNVEVWMYKGYIVLVPPDLNVLDWNCVVYFDGNAFPSVGLRAMFKNEHGTFAYFLPRYITTSRHTKTITGVDILDPFHW